MPSPGAPRALSQRFFGLRENPFNLTPDPRFIFWSRAHKEALAHLLYGINERKGFIEFTGEIGTGKTLLCRYLMGKFGKSVRTAVLFNPVLTEDELMRAIITDFGIPVREDFNGGLLDRLNRFLLQQFSEGRNAALFIDECQNLSSSLLEQIRLISNLETDRHKLIQIIMVGQPELKSLLRHPSLAQLNQRIGVR
ncbi:MAG: ExeA family protein, partial [Nitrospinota bacterium]